MSLMQIVGRRSSLFTRLPLIVAEEIGVPYELVPIYDMTALGPEVYAGNPALKLPILRRRDSVLFGALNICHAIAETVARPPNIVWPEQLRDDLSRNAHELVWHCMAAQVQLVMGTVIARLPADNVFFAKARTGLESSLEWLNQHLAESLDALPRQRDLSIYEVALFCLVEHLAWRQTIDIGGYSELNEFARAFALRPSAERTAYAFDVPPPPSG